MEKSLLCNVNVIPRVARHFPKLMAKILIKNGQMCFFNCQCAALKMAKFFEIDHQTANLATQVVPNAVKRASSVWNDK